MYYGPRFLSAHVPFSFLVWREGVPPCTGCRIGHRCLAICTPFDISAIHCQRRDGLHPCFPAVCVGSLEARTNHPLRACGSDSGSFQHGQLWRDSRSRIAADRYSQSQCPCSESCPRPCPRTGFRCQPPIAFADPAGISQRSLDCGRDPDCGAVKWFAPRYSFVLAGIATSNI